MRKTSWQFAAVLTLAAALFSFFPAMASAQSGTGSVGAQAKVSTLGIGGDVAVQIHPRANLRGGFTVFNYNHTFDKDGITYAGKLNLRSVTASLDFYVAGPFHVGPGILLYNGFKVSAVANVPSGQTFTLGGTTYQSSTASPLNGNLAMNFNKVAPELLIGIGNLIPRSGRHFTVNFDAGVVFQGSPESLLTVSGLACLPPNSSGPTCVSAATNPTVQANVQAQQTKLNGDFSILKYFPVLSFGIGYRF